MFGFYDFLLMYVSFSDGCGSFVMGVGTDIILTVDGRRSFFCKNSIVVRLFQKNRFFGQSIKWKECRTRNAKEMERTNESGMGKAYCILIPL